MLYLYYNNVGYEFIKKMKWHIKTKNTDKDSKE